MEVFNYEYLKKIDTNKTSYEWLITATCIKYIKKFVCNKPPTLRQEELWDVQSLGWPWDIQPTVDQPICLFFVLLTSLVSYHTFCSLMTFKCVSVGSVSRWRCQLVWHFRWTALPTGTQVTWHWSDTRCMYRACPTGRPPTLAHTARPSRCIWSFFPQVQF